MVYCQRPPADQFYDYIKYLQMKKEQEEASFYILGQSQYIDQEVLLAPFKNEIETLKYQNAQLEHKIHCLTEKLLQKQEVIRTKVQQIKQLSKQLIKLSKSLFLQEQLAQQHASELTSQLEELKVQAERQRLQVANDVARLNEELKQKIRDNNHLYRKKEDLKLKYENLKTQNKDLKEQLQQAEQVKQASSNHIDKFNQQLRKMSESKVILEAKIIELQSKLKTSQQKKAYKFSAEFCSEALPILEGQ